MLGSTHAALTKSVLVALGWPLDQNLTSSNATFPDAVTAITVEKYGAHLLGHGLSALAHFCQPTRNGHFMGYCWRHDRSVPAIDLSSVKVMPRPEAWNAASGMAGQLVDTDTEPTAELIRVITGHASIQADAVTYPTAGTMLRWSHRQFVRTAVAPPAGWAFHFVQDCCVPMHASGVLLDGHSAFEGDVDEQYKRMEGSGEVAALLKTLVAADNMWTGDLRELAECLAKKAYVSPRRMAWRMCWGRRSWNKTVKACVLAGLTGSVQLGKRLMAEMKAQ